MYFKGFKVIEGFKENGLTFLTASHCPRVMKGQSPGFRVSGFEESVLRVLRKDPLNNDAIKPPLTTSQRDPWFELGSRCVKGNSKLYLAARTSQFRVHHALLGISSDWGLTHLLTTPSFWTTLKSENLKSLMGTVLRLNTIKLVTE